MLLPQPRRAGEANKWGGGQKRAQGQKNAPHVTLGEAGVSHHLLHTRACGKIVGLQKDLQDRALLWVEVIAVCIHRARVPIIVRAHRHAARRWVSPHNHVRPMPAGQACANRGSACRRRKRRTGSRRAGARSRGGGSNTGLLAEGVLDLRATNTNMSIPCNCTRAPHKNYCACPAIYRTLSSLLPNVRVGGT
jgi:hypothetical protein